MMKHCSRLQAALAGMKIKQKVSCNQDLLSSSPQQLEGYQLPRYVRVNILKTTVEDAIDYLKREVFRLPGTGLQRQLNDLNLKGNLGDLQLSDLLVVSAKTDFHDHNLYKAGHIILQDKASCLPAYFVNPLTGSHVLAPVQCRGTKPTTSPPS
ncbi:28S rRNA (cytosine-C(5))-methyltransferase-like isoform X3 [Oncorhynchus keta]|uniref:28S rRNA (cytosine-C(5))-methyltransferase-like isoform X3 n=1 Tax=Oncorhynchus keta TaxID=8018 RepID=UPI00227BCFBD|nr:28S rRNA (cytosine-C(5))-methyltransferase-like isoform X3 [Oncorhynchus keta]XP_052385793.1 28S rRNA (cytosine-C(5))-methyltransferase-like isoform X3 [Oncorhynchus keta]